MAYDFLITKMATGDAAIFSGLGGCILHQVFDAQEFMAELHGISDALAEKDITRTQAEAGLRLAIDTLSDYPNPERINGLNRFLNEVIAQSADDDAFVVHFRGETCMPRAHYDLDASPALDAIERAVNVTVTHPPAGEVLFSHTGLIGVDWNRMANCHHSNTLLVAAIGGMIDAVAAEAALNPKCRLATVVGEVSGLDKKQKGALLAAAGIDHVSYTAELFTQAVNDLIDSEALGAYFERGSEAAISHYDINPYEHSLEAVKSKADQARLPTDKRIALVIVLALYNYRYAEDTFTGRGWVFHGAALGRWLTERFASNQTSARAALRAFGHYSGW